MTEDMEVWVSRMSEAVSKADQSYRTKSKFDSI